MKPTPTLLIVTGPSMHGKTTVSKRIVESVPNCEHIDIDAMRTHYFPNILAEGGARDKKGDFFLEGDAEVSTACHHYAANLIRQQLTAGRSVVFSGATSREKMKQPLLDLMVELRSAGNFFVVKIAGELGKEEIEARIQRRLDEGSHSPVVSSDVYHKIRLSQTAWPVECGTFQYHELDVNSSVEGLVESIIKLVF